MRRSFALLLCLALLACLAAPVLAAGEEAEPETAESAAQGEGMDDALAALTAQVKAALAIGDEYTEFYSNYYDGVDPSWELNWSGEDAQINVTVRPDGTVTSCYLWLTSSGADRFYGFDPAFPPLTRAEAEKQAQAQMERLFTKPESGRIDGVRTVLGTDGSYRFSGTVLENGLESPVSFTMVIGGDGLNSFYRSDDGGAYVGPLPAPEAAADEDAAAEALAGAVELELRWVSGGEGEARLMYMPVGPRTVADAATGEAVDMDALYASFEDRVNYSKAFDGVEATEEAMAPDTGAALTEVELSSIANYGDVLDQQAIDEALRTIDALGLEGFSLQRCSYAMDGEKEGDVTASVRYTAPMTEEKLYGYSKAAFDDAKSYGQDLTIYKYITLDAKTGAIRSLSTSYPLWEREQDALGLTDRLSPAEEFLALAVPELMAQAEPCTLKGYDEGDELVFAQVHEGYFYPDNSITVHVDPTSGTVDQFYYDWDEDVTFASSEGIVSEKEALAAYEDALEVTLGYVAWPIDITAADDPIYDSYIQWGYTYVEELRLAYYYGGVGEVRGVDALTGEAERSEQTEESFAYDDVGAAPEKEMIETLGLAGVGFAGGKFQPEAALTVRDAVTLLLQAEGSYVPERDEDLLARAADQRFMEAGGDSDKVVTRMEFIKMILTPSRYGDAAQLGGIWASRFEDANEGDAGYAAIATALNMADGSGMDPREELTRADAAAILYQFMAR